MYLLNKKFNCIKLNIPNIYNFILIKN